MKKDKSVRKAEIKAAIKKKLKSLIGPFILLGIIAAVILIITLYQEPEEEQEIIRVNGYEGEETELVLENDELKLVMDAATTQFTLTTKDSGKVWYSNPEGAESDAMALKIEKDKLRSTMTLTYSTVNGVDTLYNNYTYSMEKGIYDIEQGDDYIKVYYSIGDTEKEYVIPPIILKADMEALLVNMEKNEATRVKDYYKLYDINNLGKKDNKEELLANYPILETEVAYVLRSTTKDNLKVKMEQYFEAAGYTMEDYERDKAMDMTVTVSEKPVFNVNVIYRLEGNDLVVEVPFNEIEYREDYPIYYLSVLPYFGAGGTEDEGFLFVPEGGGALINFNNGKTAQSSYYANVYGWDMAQDREAVVHETRTYFNVFGEANGEDSFICIIESGAPYASIQADVSGKSNSYNYVNAIYSMVHREQYDVSDRTNAEMYVYEDSLPDESIIQRYRFIASNDYTDMAAVYRDYLLNEYEGYMTANDDIEAPVTVEVVGAVDKVKQVFGVPVSKPLALTGFKEAQGVINDLYANGFTNMNVKMTGWMNGGVQQKILNDIDIVSDLGSAKDFKNMIADAENKGVAVYLDGVTNYAYDSDIWDGFFSYMDAARFVSKDRAELYEYNTVSYGKRESQDTYYLLHANIIQEMADNLVAGAVKYGANVSFRDYGYELSSDFYRKNLVSRQSAMLAQTEQLKEIHDSGMNVMINMGNDYAAPYADVITNMDLQGTEYTIIDAKIPFYQMALHGYVNYTGYTLNLAQNCEEELLRSAEYGAGLSFAVMDETTFTLQNTLYTQYFGAEYDAWRDKIISIYTRYNEELGHTFNQQMVDHEIVSDAVRCSVYADGTKVYVNYGYTDAVADGVTVPARDYIVVK